MVISLRGSFCLDELLGRTAAGLDASTNRDEKCTCGADDSKNGCWIFWGVHATALSIQREGDGREEGDAG
jgi:hypothetical protein